MMWIPGEHVTTWYAVVGDAKVASLTLDPAIDVWTLVGIERTTHAVTREQFAYADSVNHWKAAASWAEEVIKYDLGWWE